MITSRLSGKRFHLSGIAGVGMSPLAFALRHFGCTVSGSDRSFDQGYQTALRECMLRAGMELFPQDGSAIHDALDALVVSSAVEADNPERKKAVSLGIPQRHRTEIIANLIGSAQVVAVAGTAGKTTITGMIGHLLTACGRAPTVLNGGSVINWSAPDNPGGFHAGDPDLWVLEVDESDRSLLRFHPDWAVVSNIAQDHFALSEIQQLFGLFLRQVKHTAVLSPDALAQLPGADVSARLMIPDATDAEDGGSTFIMDGLSYTPPLPGRHNRENTLLALALCKALGAAPQDLQNALPEFRGIRRRLEKVGRLGAVEIYDDYAHNPLKISAAITALQGSARRLFCVWRPHGFAPLRLQRTELVQTLNHILRPDDRFLMLPVYYAGGTVDATVSAQDVVDELKQADVAAEYCEGYDPAEQALHANVQDGDIILIMGARDPELPAFARRLIRS